MKPILRRCLSVLLMAGLLPGPVWGEDESASAKTYIRELAELTLNLRKSPQQATLWHERGKVPVKVVDKLATAVLGKIVAHLHRARSLLY